MRNVILKGIMVVLGLLLAGCSPAQVTMVKNPTSAPAPSATMPPVVNAETPPPVQATSSGPLAQATSRGDQLQASPPADVKIGTGQPVLIEFFRYT